MTKEQKIHIKELKSLYKKDHQLFAVLADCLFEYGQGKEAEKILKDNLPQYPDYLTALLVWGKILYYKKSYEEAKEVFLKITKMNNKCVKAYKFLGDIELKLDNREGYLSYYTEILRYDAFSTNAKNVITLLGKKYDFATEDDLISKYYSDQNIELAGKNAEQPAEESPSLPLKSASLQPKSSVQSEFEKKIAITKSQIDLGNMNYKQAIKEINEQYVRNKKADVNTSAFQETSSADKRGTVLSRPAVEETPRIDKINLAREIKEDALRINQENEKERIPDKQLVSNRSRIEEQTKNKIDDFFQAQLAKPDKPVSRDEFTDKPLFHEHPAKIIHEQSAAEKMDKPADLPVQKPKQPEQAAPETAKKTKEDSFSDVEAMFEGVTSSPANMPKISLSALEKSADAKNNAAAHEIVENSVPAAQPAVDEIVSDTAVEKSAENVEAEAVDVAVADKEPVEMAFQFVESKEIELEKKKSLKDFYQPMQKTVVEHEADFDIVEDIRKSGEFDSLDDMMKHHSQLSDEAVEPETSESENDQSDHNDEQVIPETFKQSLLRNYDDVDLVEEERVYAQAEDVESGGQNAAGTIQVDQDNSFKKVVVDKVIGETEAPKKRSIKIATSTLGEIYAAQGEFHKAKENYYELMTKYPENGDYKIKFLQAEFNIASIRINEELDYYRNLMEQYPDMQKYRERYESYQTEFNNLKNELELKIESVKKKFQNEFETADGN